MRNIEQNLAPQGELVIKTLAMPSDTNANGDIFGGWVLSQMDIGGGKNIFTIWSCSNSCN